MYESIAKNVVPIQTWYECRDTVMRGILNLKKSNYSIKINLELQKTKDLTIIHTGSKFSSYWTVGEDIGMCSIRNPKSLPGYNFVGKYWEEIRLSCVK